MNIPFVDLKAQYQSIKAEIDTAIKNVIDETAFIKGKYVQKLWFLVKKIQLWGTLFVQRFGY